MTKKVSRDLNLIGGELQTVLAGESKNVAVIGSLLIEARSHLEHGEWLPWLMVNFSLSVRSAENYMAAARFAAKYETVANLKLRPSALYALGNHYMADEPVVGAVLAEAEHGWVSGDRVHDIAELLMPEPTPTGADLLAELEEEKEERAAEEERFAAEQAEIDEMLDGAPPELPPTPDATMHDVIVPPFDQAIKTLTGLQTKPLSKFTDTAYSPEDLRAISTFLREVADAMGRRDHQAA